MTLRTIVVLLGFVTTALAQQTVIKLGTLAPDGSPWHQVILRIGERWRNVTNGKVKLISLPGGTLGDEPDLVNKTRIGQLQALAISGAGLSAIEPGVACLQIPMMFSSYEELDYVRDRMAPRLEKMIEARGFVVLNWGDAGWVHFFTGKPVTRLDDMRKMKLFTWAGDNDVLELWRANGFHAVPLAATDIAMGLKNGLIEVVPTTPLYALWNLIYRETHYMVDVKWAPLVGGTLMSKRTWDALPENYRVEMLKAAREAGQDLRGGIRKMGDDALAAMKKEKLTVMSADATVLGEWRREAESIYPKLRGRTIPADLFDQVRSLRDEFRTRAGGSPR